MNYSLSLWAFVLTSNYLLACLRVSFITHFWDFCTKLLFRKSIVAMVYDMKESYSTKLTCKSRISFMPWDLCSTFMYSYLHLQLYASQILLPAFWPSHLQWRWKAVPLLNHAATGWNHPLLGFIQLCCMTKETVGHRALHQMNDLFQGFRSFHCRHSTPLISSHPCANSHRPARMSMAIWWMAHSLEPSWRLVCSWCFVTPWMIAWIQSSWLLFCVSMDC